MKDQPQKRDSREDAVMRAYALVGRAAADFATLEFHLQFLTSFLISGKHLSPEAVILTRLHTFADKIQLIREFVPFRFPKENPLRARVLKLVDDLSALRERRNFFIHGYWLINWQLIISEGLIRCSDPKWRFDNKTEEWKSMQSHDIRFDELEDLIRSIGATTHEAHGVLKELEKNNGGEQSAAPLPPAPAGPSAGAR
jgi:hypothetical protein